MEGFMKKTYEKPAFARREVLSKVTASNLSEQIAD
jgi:hypothetical protein